MRDHQCKTAKHDQLQNSLIHGGIPVNQKKRNVSAEASTYFKKPCSQPLMKGQLGDLGNMASDINK